MRFVMAVLGVALLSAYAQADPPPDRQSPNCLLCISLEDLVVSPNAGGTRAARLSDLSAVHNEAVGFMSTNVTYPYAIGSAIRTATPRYLVASDITVKTATELQHWSQHVWMHVKTFKTKAGKKWVDAVATTGFCDAPLVQVPLYQFAGADGRAIQNPIPAGYPYVFPESGEQGLSDLRLLLATQPEGALNVCLGNLTAVRYVSSP